jgi:hypothetical protein
MTVLFISLFIGQLNIFYILIYADDVYNNVIGKFSDKR